MSNYIKSLTLQGILSFAPDSPPIALNRLNVIIGPNGAGKSNFVDILRFITTIPSDIEQGFYSLGGQSDFFWRGDWQGKDVLAQINVSTTMTESEETVTSVLSYGIKLSPHLSEFIVSDELLNLIREYLVKDKKNKKIVKNINYTLDRSEYVAALKKGRENFESNSKSSMLNDLHSVFNMYDEKKIDGFLFRASTLLLKNFFSNPLFLQTWGIGRRAEIRRPQPTDYPVTRLMPDYRNLGLILNEIKNRDPELIYAPMRRIIPDFDRLNIDILGGNIVISISEKDLKGPTSAFRMSDGTLRFLAILAAIHCKDPPSILVIEEPEIALHPDALICLAEILIEASKKTQIFITTHSEILLSAFRNHLDSVLVCQNRGAGTTMTHLDPNDLAEMLETYSLGQIWASGQIGGNP
ncbi:MAG: AAA family ATPase [Alphaproteobacteria bacterium]|nr:AAA family ATPase [Alphaproteobacteria bacterium]